MYLELKYDDKIEIINKECIRYISYYVTNYRDNNSYNIDIEFVGGSTCYISSDNEDEILSVFSKLKNSLYIE